MDVAKPFNIPKKLVWEAYLRVKASGGGPGVDGQTIENFEVNLKNNLYRVWNRMSSGSYFPPPVKRVAIPKSDGRERRLGVPTVAGRVAQNVVARVLDSVVEPQFHPDSYGYRRGRSAHDAVARARERCRRYDWALDLDIRAFFDTRDHRLMMRAVQRYTRCRLEVHPAKTKIVYCRDSNRRGLYPEVSFDFLGYTFRPRRVRNRGGQLFTRFSPAPLDPSRTR